MSHQPEHLSSERSWQTVLPEYRRYISLIRGHTYSRDIAGTRDEIRSAILASAEKKMVGSYYLSYLVHLGKPRIHADITIFLGRSSRGTLLVRAKSATEVRMAAELLVGEIRLPTAKQQETTLSVRLYRHIQILWPIFIATTVALFVLAALLFSGLISTTSHSGIGFGVLGAAVIVGFVPTFTPFFGAAYMRRQENELVDWFNRLDTFMGTDHSGR